MACAIYLSIMPITISLAILARACLSVWVVKKDENVVRLWSNASIYDGFRELLTLKEKDGNYYIKSFQMIADGE